jgi:D-alanine transfer protein
MANVKTESGTAHLFSALIACAVLILCLVAGRMFAIHLEKRTVRATAPRPFDLKNQGLAFQRVAWQTPDVLLIYGSSELRQRLPENASYFFRTAPTGFQVSAVGKAGTSSIIILQKIAALAADVRGKKIVLSLSPSWFLPSVINPRYYEGNFSLEAASGMVFGDALDFELKRKIAVRILQSPPAPSLTPLLRFALEQVAAGSWLDRVIFWGLWPMGKAQNVVLDLQDHFHSLLFIFQRVRSTPQLHRETLDWPNLMARAEADAAILIKTQIVRDSENAATVGHTDDAAFLGRLAQAHEWTDLDLLLRTLRELHVQPLILSMPIPGVFFEQCGVSRSAREVYYNKIRAIAQRYSCSLADFADHDGDDDFLIVPRNHLTPKGWMFYDRALDSFFHGRGS